MKIQALSLLTGLLLASSTASVWAADTPRDDYAHSRAGKALIDKLYQQDKVPPEFTQRLLGKAKYQSSIIERMNKPAEKTLTWGEYRPIFVQDKRAKEGAEYIKDHRKAFKQAQSRYGVPAAMIAAIIGVETRYGDNIGDDRVLDALATLAFDYPERSEFFTKELGYFIKLCHAEKLHCTREIGSYAGAMGLGQFMPSSYEHYAVDGNNNGRRDLWHEPADIISSVANYLAENGWQRDLPIAWPARLQNPEASDDIQTSTRKTHYRWRELAAKGVKVDNPPDPDTRVGLLEFEGKHGTEYWVATQNFFVITTYNTSPLYAMAAFQLSRMIDSLTHPDDLESR